MKTCSKCGARVKDNVKYCTECGSEFKTAFAKGSMPAIPSGSSQFTEPEAANDGKRRQEFSGKVMKCPNCGEVLKALAAKCPACGFELREVGNASSVKEFSERLNSAPYARQKVSLIRNFPIPNAKADIFEFLILATSNFETQRYMNSSGIEREMADAWLGKIEQSYQKAEALFKDDRDFEKFKAIYESDIKELAAAKAAGKNRKHYFFGTIMMLMAAMIFLILMLRGSGIVANPRLDFTVLGFFANGIISYLYAGKKGLKLIALITYSANAILNVVFCFFAPGHIFHVLIIVACALGAFIDKKVQ